MKIDMPYRLTRGDTHALRKLKSAFGSMLGNRFGADCNAWFWELERRLTQSSEVVLVTSRDFHDRMLLATPADSPIVGFKLSDEGLATLSRHYIGHWATIYDVLRDLDDPFWSRHFAMLGLTDADVKRIRAAMLVVPLLYQRGVRM